MKKKAKLAYLVGIKGVAMTAMAVYLKEKGYQVTGSDVADYFATQEILARNKIPVKEGFSPDNIERNFDIVIVTGAHGGMTNIEAKTAVDKGLTVMMHGKFLGRLLDDYYAIAVSGSHGKTTTSAMTAHLLATSGFDPSYAIGTAFIPSLGAAGHCGRGKFFVCEADEYMTCPNTDRTPRFLYQNPKIIVMTNIDYDHPDSYRSIADVEEAFSQFALKLPQDGVLIVCRDDPRLTKIARLFKGKVLSFGFSKEADFVIANSFTSGKLNQMRIGFRNLIIGEINLVIAGRHNLLNALAAGIAANQIGLSWEKIKTSLRQFTGSNRRFERIGGSKLIELYDDYAHHPTEIKTTISAFKDWFKGRSLTVIFQPHTYSRTKRLLFDFASSFTKADLCLVTDIFASGREQDDKSINSKILVNEINKVRPNAVYIKNKADLLNKLAKNTGSPAVLVTMGAGDLYNWHSDILKIINSIDA